jgi:hypothetical protein
MQHSVIQFLKSTRIEFLLLWPMNQGNQGYGLTKKEGRKSRDTFPLSLFKMNDWLSYKFYFKVMLISDRKEKNKHHVQYWNENVWTNAELGVL